MAVGSTLNIILSDSTAQTEIWTPETGSLESKDPDLERGLLAYGIGLWLVDAGYCARN